MKTYSLITKPYRIRLKRHHQHTLVNTITSKGITFKEGTEFWCAKAYSQDHSDCKSLFLFNHSFCTSFALGSPKVIRKWEIIETDKNWRDEISVLQTELLALNLITDGTIPGFVKRTK